MFMLIHDKKQTLTKKSQLLVWNGVLLSHRIWFMQHKSYKIAYDMTFQLKISFEPKMSIFFVFMKINFETNKWLDLELDLNR